jgi:flavin prenyltransferase
MLPESQNHGSAFKRLVVAISGASGAMLGIRLLQVVERMPVETHLVLSDAAKSTILEETSWSVSQVLDLATVVHDVHQIGASIASGSIATLGMVVIPCSIKTLSAIANSYTNDLISRAADVTLKEGRPLVLVVREAPLHRGHLRLMSLAADNGAIIYPPVPAFYTRPQSVDDVIDNIVGRVLERMGLSNDLYQTWKA